MAALPLHGKIDQFLAADPAKRPGIDGYRGPCGDVFLTGEPQGARIADVKVNTSVRDWRLELAAGVAGLAEGTAYRLRGMIQEAARPGSAAIAPAETTIESQPFTSADLAGNRLTFAKPWHPQKLWDLNTPGNHYDLSLSLLNSDGAVIDELPPVRFGFREFRIDGRDFRLNGSRILLSALPLENTLFNTAAASYEGASDTFRRLKHVGINTVYTHNYNCLPGADLAYTEFLRAADDAGVLVCFTLPHLHDYDWSAKENTPGDTNGYAHDAAYFIRQAQNHPAVVMYSTSHNDYCYDQDNYPDAISGTYAVWRDAQGKPAPRTIEGVTRVEQIIRRFDATRPIYHHAGGDLGDIYTLNCYLNFAPIQDRSDWFGPWSGTGTKPLFLVEYGLPLTECWTNYREGWVIFGSNMLTELMLPEWGAQFRGDRAYELTEQEKADIRFEAEHWRKQQMFHKSTYPAYPNELLAPNQREVQAKYIAQNWPAFRTWGVSGFSPWPFDCLWTPRPGVNTGTRSCQVDWERLQQPGFSPDFIIPTGWKTMDLDFQESDWMPTVAGEAFLRFNRPLLAYVAGKPDHFTERGHNFLPGQTVEKQIIVINNSRLPVTCSCKWSVSPAAATARPGVGGIGASGSQQVHVETGEQARVLIRFTLPAKATSGPWPLTMTAVFSTGETQKDTFELDVLAPVALSGPTTAAAASGSGGRLVAARKTGVAAASPLNLPGARGSQQQARVALYDPKGETGRMLAHLGVGFDTVTADANLSGRDVLVIGKDALTPFGPAPDLSRVRGGLKVVVFEQTKDVLEKRLGFRVQEYCLRQVFPRVAGHPVLDGLSPENLCNWRSEGTTVPPRIPQGSTGMVPYPSDERAGVDARRVWRVGCWGSVASLLIEKPACGDFVPICDGGFSLQYSPLMEYREGRGMIVFCQLDVTNRTEEDPAADRLVRNILAYAHTWKAAPRREVIYAGAPAGKAFLESTGLTVEEYAGGELTAAQVLMVGPAGGTTLAPHAAGIARWLAAGGNLLALGLDQDEANSSTWMCR